MLIVCLELTKLTTLDLDATGITNDIVPMITQSHPKLVCLNLSGTSVTNQGLERALGKCNKGEQEKQCLISFFFSFLSLVQC
jgi:hypothetical protein